MRLLSFTLFVMLAGPMTATAQTRGHRPPPTATVAPIGLPQIGGPLPQIGAPLPRLGLPPLNSGFRQIIPFHDGEFPGTEFARVKHLAGLSNAPVRRRRFVGMPMIVYAVPYVIPLADPPQPPAVKTETRLTTGSLVLLVEPATAQVFVDGYYFGMPEDFDGQRGELELDQGPHKLELMAPGYETVIVGVRIV